MNVAFGAVTVVTAPVLGETIARISGRTFRPPGPYNSGRRDWVASTGLTHTHPVEVTGYRPSEAELATLAAEQQKTRQWARRAHRGQLDGADLPEFLATYTSLRDESTKALATVERWPLRDFDRPAGAEVPIGELQRRLQVARQEARKAEQNALISGWTFKGDVWTTPPDEQPSFAERLSEKAREAMVAAIGTAPDRRERDTWLEWARLATAGSAHAKRFAAGRGFELPFNEKRSKRSSKGPPERKQPSGHPAVTRNGCVG